MIESSDETQKQNYGTSFCKDIEGHINKIKTDYVKPEEGTTPFAFGFIPSEAVYQYLTECHPALVADAAKEGVLVVSPATLAINLNLLTMGLDWILKRMQEISMVYFIRDAIREKIQREAPDLFREIFRSPGPPDPKHEVMIPLLYRGHNRRYVCGNLHSSFGGRSRPAPVQHS